MSYGDSTDPIVFCTRCGRVMPSVDDEDGDYCEWEAQDESGNTVICPACLTGEELTAMADDFSNPEG